MEFRRDDDLSEKIKERVEADKEQGGKDNGKGGN